ncbi:ZIP family metal transporter [Telmatospirillum sp. J64-1]|uniref:ZIP family metal transporter n=1 Tax=Telmatospirillum sp. J64-1 TaxID=2502183 RepID=UPI00115DE9BE|nr:ZIP family metal transporter [Telmatospirillum sp. J64-1]
MISAVAAFFDGLTTFQAGVLASFLAGLGAGFGALPVMVLRNLTQKTQDVMLGFAAGIMLAASAFSLILPGIEEASPRWGEVTGSLVVGLSVMIGAAGLWLMHRHLPHEHFIKGRDDISSKTLKRLWMFIIAITLHNFPEGLAVGVGFGTENVGGGLTLMTAIFLQNLPEGLIVAMAFAGLGYKRSTAVLLALATGLVETVGGVVGAGVITLSMAMLPMALAFAGGAMIFVVSHEVIPETHRNGFETPATFGLTGGFVLMTILDVALDV